ncbi:hypothetical protein [Streptomyces sp. NPDC094144]|uniref:hypothetical protein n=1 Tax=Streptomyces sp. NPDC094144 TaxID=3366056 RepID=UPI0038307E85
MAHRDGPVRLRRATWWCRTTGTAALVTCAVTALSLLFPAPGNRALGDTTVTYAVLTALLTVLWWIGALLAPPLTAPPLPAGPGSGNVPARLPRLRTTRATMLPALFLAVFPLVVVRTIGAHAGPLDPLMPLLTGVAALLCLLMLRGWLGALNSGSAHSGPAELRRDAAAGEVAARRVRVGPAVWVGEGDGRWSASRRLMVVAEDRQIALRTAQEESARFGWLDLESAAVLEGREGWLCWAAAGGSWGDPTEQMGAALVTDDGYVVWGSTDRHVAEAAYAPEHSCPTAPRSVRRAPRASLYRPDVHGYALAMAAVTLLALVLAERGVGPDALSWCLALAGAFTGVRGVYGYTQRLADRPGPGWAPRSRALPRSPQGVFRKSRRRV